MRPKVQIAAFVTSVAAVILLVGCPPNPTYFSSFAYTGPLLPFGPGGTAPSCPTCQIVGVFTLNSPVGFTNSVSPAAYSTVDLKANGLKSFDFKISGWTLGGNAPDFSSANGGIVTRLSVTGLDAKNNLGNWNIQVGSSDGKYLATCNASAAFMTDHPGPHPWDAGFPSGAACSVDNQASPIHDVYSGGGNLQLEGNAPGVMTGM